MNMFAFYKQISKEGTQSLPVLKITADVVVPVVWYCGTTEEQEFHGDIYWFGMGHKTLTCYSCLQCHPTPGYKHDE